MSKSKDATVILPLGVERFRSAYSPRVRVSISFPAEGRTKQSFKDECDVNRIMARYLGSGILPQHLMQAQAQFVDCTALDFQEAALIVAGAKSLFNVLPASVRERFRHDPAAFLEFAENPANGPALVEMGLATVRDRLVQGGSGDQPRDAVASVSAAPAAKKGGEGELVPPKEPKA